MAFRTSGLISFAPSPQLDPRFGVDLALAVSECPALWPSPRVEMSGPRRVRFVSSVCTVAYVEGLSLHEQSLAVMVQFALELSGG